MDRRKSIKSDDLEVSDQELAELTANRSLEDKFKDALIHMYLVAIGRHEFTLSCDGCKDAKRLADLPY